MNENPFTSETFESIWLKHFEKGHNPISFKEIPEISFVENTLSLFLVNVGKNLTKGIRYSINRMGGGTLQNNTLLVYDVFPENPQELHSNEDFKIKRIRQYPGFRINLSQTNSLEEYMSSFLSKRSRPRFKRNLVRFDTCFDVSFQMLGKDITKEKYDALFDSFYNILTKRFTEKKIRNNNLNPKEWAFYKDVVYRMMLENNASIFVAYHFEKPIAISLHYLFENTLIDGIRTFDITFEKFNLGTISIMKLIEWCYDNNINTLDFSKGFFEYKNRWCNEKYDFEYHIIYNPKSFLSMLKAELLSIYFRLKCYLRDKKVNRLLHKIAFRIRHKKKKNVSNVATQIIKIEEENNALPWVKLDNSQLHSQNLKKAIFDLLYSNPERFANLAIFENELRPEAYLVKGKNFEKVITLTNLKN